MRGEAKATGAVGERTRDVALARAGRAAEQDGFVGFDPGTGGESQHETLVEAAGTAVLDVLRGGGKRQPGQLQQPRESAILAARIFAFDQECDAVLKGQRPDVGHDRLFFECDRHAEQLQFAQAIDGGLQQHQDSPPAAAA